MIKIKSGATGEVFEIVAQEFVWARLGEEDHGAGVETFYEAAAMRSASDGSTVTVTVDASEYPAGGQREINDVTVVGGTEVE